MKKGDTRPEFERRFAEGMRAEMLNRLEADEKFLELQLSKVKRQIAELTADKPSC